MWCHVFTDTSGHLQFLVFERSCHQIVGSDHQMKMTEQQTLEYKLYKAACRLSNVEPTRADFLAGDIPNCVVSVMEYEQNEAEWGRRKALAASA
jgi:hypothetical protein